MTDDLKARAEKAAAKLYTHARDCTCKGNYVEKDKSEGYVAGYLVAAQEAEALVRSVEEACAVEVYRPGDDRIFNLLRSALLAYRGGANGK